MAQILESLEQSRQDNLMRQCWGLFFDKGVHPK
jgi:hypothetical protein